ncbi:hypothetical protein HDU81_009861 [Chytriomyces hyalinus]|nr:hypothetical protein HDU81_009861 [Chytriomyces hyalinus]
MRSAFENARATITSEASAVSSQPRKRLIAKAGHQQAQGAEQGLNIISEPGSEDFDAFDGFDDDPAGDEHNQAGHDADEDAETDDELWGIKSFDNAFDAFSMSLTKQVKLHSSAKILCDAGFFPSAPAEPVAAFSFKLLEITLKFQNEKSNKVSNYGAAMAFFNLNESPYLNKVHDTVYKQFNECLNEYSIVGRTTCPCSGRDVPTENSIFLNPMPDQIKLPRIFANDGNFQMKHKSTAFGGGAAVLAQELFISGMTSMVNGKETNMLPKSDCESTFTAGETNKTKDARCDINGVFGSCCRHCVLNVLIDIPKGEKLSLYFSVLKHLQGKYPSSQILNFYDIMCKADAHYDIHQQRFIEANIFPAYIGFMPVLHAYAHGKDCQVKFSGNLVMGAGTFDGEVIERFWAYISNHIGHTQRQTIENRADAIFLMVEHAAVDKNKQFCESIKQWCKAAMNEIATMKIEAAEGAEGTFHIKPYCKVVQENRKYLNQSNSSSNSSIFKKLIKNKSPDVLREAEALWLAICNMSIKFQRKKIRSKAGKTSSAKAKEHADAAKKTLNHIKGLIAEFKNLPNKDSVDIEIQAMVGAEGEDPETSLVLDAIRSDLVIQLVEGNPNTLQEQYWRRIEDLYHHSLDLKRGVKAFKSKVTEYQEICDSIESTLHGRQLTAALFFLNAAKQKAQESSAKCFEVLETIAASISKAGLSGDVAEVASGFKNAIHQSANNKQL